MGEAKRRKKKRRQPEGSIPVRERLDLDDMWKEFRQVIPADAPPRQVVEMKRAFYSGAVGLWDAVFGSLDADKEPTKLDEAHLAHCLGQIEKFRQDLEEGRA